MRRFFERNVYSNNEATRNNHLACQSSENEKENIRCRNGEQ